MNALADFLPMFLLKVTLVLAIGLAGHALLHRANPRWRVFCTRLTALFIFAMPLVAWLMPAMTLKIPRQAERPLPTAPVKRARTFPAPAAESAIIPTLQSSTAAAPANVNSAAPLPPPSIPITLLPIPAILFSAYGIVLAALFLRLWIAHRFVRRTVRFSIAAPESITRDFGSIVRQLGSTRRADVRIVHELSTPFLTGVWHPTLLLPAAMLADDYRADLRGILFHEASHLRTHDLAWSLGLHCLRILLWFHPMAWWLESRHAAACEAVSDAVGAEHLGDAPRYSRLLARVTIDLVSNPPPCAGIPMARLSEISRRLLQLKCGLRATPLSRGRVALATIPAMLAIGMIGGLRIAAASPADSKPIQRPSTSKIPATSGLQSRIDAAKPGETVDLAEGTYDQPIAITKPLVLRGAGSDKTRFKMLANTPAISVRGTDHVRIENISMIWSPKSTDARIPEPAAIAVRDSELLLTGVHLAPFDRPAETPTGLMVAGRSDVTFTKGSTTAFAYAILFTDGAKGTVSDSTLMGADHSEVTLHSGTNVEIAGNIMGNCDYHAVRNTGGTMAMHGNLVVGDHRAGAYLGNQPAHGVIENNLFMGSQGEIWAYSGSDVIVRNNLFMNSGGTAIGMEGSCSLAIFNNSFLGNPSAVSVYNKGKGSTGKPVLDGNHYWDIATKFIGIDADPKLVEADPRYVDPAGGNFEPGPGSPLISGASQIGLTDSVAISALVRRWQATGGVIPPKATPAPPPAPPNLEQTQAEVSALEKLAAANPQDPQGLWNLRMPLNHLVEALGNAGRYDEALKASERRLQVGRELMRRFPDDPSSANGLAWGLAMQGRIHRHLGNERLALECFNESVGLMANAKIGDTDYGPLDALATAFLELGRIDEARPLVVKLRALNWETNAASYNQAAIDQARKAGLLAVPNPTAYPTSPVR